jgi:hypothetical protein
MSVVHGEPLATRSQVATEVGRIFGSTYFCDSPILQKLLTYLVEQTLEGNAGNIKEYSIGTEVFQRGPNFDPRLDSIVRVQVSVLRKKLAAYYEGSGRHDELRIEVPRGHYAAEFITQSAAVVAPAAEAVSVAQVKRIPSSSWLPVAGLVVGMALVWALDRLSVNSPVPVKVAAGSEWRDHPLWAGFVGPQANTRLVIGVPLVVGLGGGLIVRDTAVNRPEDVPASGNLNRLTKESGRKATPEEVYTGLGEAAGISRIDRFFHASGQDVPLIRNRLTTWHDLSTSNVIFLSSFRFRTLGQELARPVEFEFVPLTGSTSAVRNLRPKKGESALYAPSMVEGGTGLDYALVTVWPGTAHGRRIMMVGGSHTWGTEGAAVYITDPEALRDLRKKLKPADAAETLQILLRVEVKDAQVVSTEYVTHHWVH